MNFYQRTPFLKILFYSKKIVFSSWLHRFQPYLPRKFFIWLLRTFLEYLKIFALHNTVNSKRKKPLNLIRLLPRKKNNNKQKKYPVWRIHFYQNLPDTRKLMKHLQEPPKCNEFASIFTQNILSRSNWNPWSWWWLWLLLCSR